MLKGGCYEAEDQDSDPLPRRLAKGPGVQRGQTVACNRQPQAQSSLTVVIYSTSSTRFCGSLSSEQAFQAQLRVCLVAGFHRVSFHGERRQGRVAQDHTVGDLRAFCAQCVGGQARRAEQGGAWESRRGVEHSEASHKCTARPSLPQSVKLTSSSASSDRSTKDVPSKIFRNPGLASEAMTIMGGFPPKVGPTELSLGSEGCSAVLCHCVQLGCKGWNIYGSCRGRDQTGSAAKCRSGCGACFQCARVSPSPTTSSPSRMPDC